MAGKTRKKLTLATLKTGYNKYTTDIRRTIIQLLNHFVPEDCEEGEDVHHIRVRREAEAPVHTPNDAEFTRQEVQSALEGFDTR